MASVSLTAVIVAHNSLGELRRTLPSLLAELRPEDELIVVDNASSDGLAAELSRLAPAARLVMLPENLGFAGGVNAGAAAAGRDLLVLLNPDARVQRGWGDAIRRPWGGLWSAWMGLVLLDGGERINTSGGVLHFTGFGWAGQVGEPVEAAPSMPREVGFLSGACFAIPRSGWLEAGGFAEHFFMYCEDVDLSLKLRLLGGRLAVVPDARVEHAYDFLKDSRKWRMLERNRWATVLRTYPAAILAPVLPVMLITELVVWVVAIRGGWARAKAVSTVDVLRALPQWLRERHGIQARRRVSADVFAAYFTSSLTSPYFGALGASPWVSQLLGLYWRAVVRAIG